MPLDFFLFLESRVVLAESDPVPILACPFRILLVRQMR